MRILHILSTPRAEGTPNLVLDWLATGLHEQDVYVLNSQPGDLSERLRSAAAWYEEGDHFSLGWRKFPAITATIRRVCQARRPDLVVCWPTGFSNWACLGAKLAGVRRLVVHSGNPPDRSRRGDWITRYVMWPLAWMGADCICCSDYVRNAFRSVPGVRKSLFHSVHNCSRAGIVAERSAASKAERNGRGSPIAIMVATLEAHKDHPTLFRAIPEIVSRIPDFRLKLAGAGSLRQELETMVRTIGIADHVEFLGMRGDVPELLGSADLFVFATTPQEGLGSVLLEALAAGLPVVASDVPACRELLVGGKHGTLVPPANPAALATAIIENLGGPACDIDSGRKYAASFTAERMIAAYCQVAGIQDP